MSYKEGDKVRYIGCLNGGRRIRGDSRFFPEIGTFGMVMGTNGNDKHPSVLVLWPRGSTTARLSDGECRWWINSSSVALVEDEPPAGVREPSFSDLTGFEEE